MSTCPCYTDLPVAKKSYNSCDNGVCGKTEYLRPVGEITGNFNLKCSEIFNPLGDVTYVFDPARVKLKANVPTGQIVTFHVDIRFPGSDLFGGNHFNNVPVYANAAFGFSNVENSVFFVGSGDVGQIGSMQLVYNAYLNGTAPYNPALGIPSIVPPEIPTGGISALMGVTGASIFVRKGTQIFAGVH